MITKYFRTVCFIVLALLGSEAIGANYVTTSTGLVADGSSPTIPSISITGLGTMSTQNANAAALTGGTETGVVYSNLTASLPIFTDASKVPTSTAPSGYPAVNTGSVSCGTGCASVTGSGSRFTITGGTGISSIVVNFGTTWGATPVCTVSDNSTTSAADISALSTSSITVGLSVALTGATVYALCSG